MALLEVEGLTRAPWWRGVRFDLERGALRVLRGDSGSGKTLLLRALADLDPVDEGTVRLEGRDRGEMAAHEWRRRVRYVHQNAPRLVGTVSENVAAIAAVCDATATHVPGLDPGADAALLSGGEAQRLALHRSLLGGPEVLLLDEVTSALDAAAARAAEERVLAFAAQGGAVLWVSHSAELAARLGAEVLNLEELTA